MTARDILLDRLRKATGCTTSASDVLDQRPCHPRPQADYAPLSRFIARAESLSSTVNRLAERNDIPTAVARYLEAEGLPKNGVCWPEFAELDWSSAGLEFTSRKTEGSDLVGITGAYCAIAETGTLMLLSGEQTPAAMSLLPETHIAVVDASRVVPQMEEAWALLKAEHKQLPRAVNFVSGPSRTADIEQTVTLGAHGPYRVHLLILGE